MAARKSKGGGNAFANADLDELQKRTAKKQSKASEIAAETPSAKKKNSKKQAKASVEEPEPEKSVMLGVRITPDEKMRLQIYCAKNRMTQERVIREFINGLEY